MKNIPKIRFPEFSGEWMEKKLGEIAVCEDNKRIPLNESERNQKKGKYPYWGSTKIMDYVDDYIFDGEYVLLSEDGGYFYDYKDKPIAFYVNGKFWANNHIHVLKINKNNNTKFIYYTLAHKNILAYIIGGTRTKLNQKDMLKIKIHIPPTIEEQQKIANFLSAVDEKIEITTKRIEKLKEYKKGLLQKLLNVENGVPELRFPEFSGEWVEKRLGEVGNIKYGKGQNEIKNKIGNFPIIGTGGILGTSGEYLYDKESIILGRKGTIDKPIYINKPFWCVDTTFFFEFYKEYVPKFIFYLLNKINWKIYNESTGVPSLSSNTIKKIKIHIPPTIEEQQKIANFLSAVDEKIELNEQVLDKLKEYKRGLLQKMFV